MFRSLLLAASFCFLTSPSGAQETRFVDDTGIDAGDCTDPKNPCATIGFAIDQAESGDIIDIAAGTYTESITLNKDLALQGAGWEFTVIQAHEEPGQANERVITISGDQETEISGVTIRHGRALDASGPGAFGGGLYNDGGSLTIEDVAFESNEANLLGGGLYNSTGSSPTLTEVVFTNNVTHVACTGCGGGGLFHGGDSITLNDVTFEENTTASSGGGILSAGGSSLALSNAQFDTNTASSSGGGLAAGDTATLTHVTFRNNVASNGGGLAVGSTATLTHVTFQNNEAGGGGGMFTAAFTSSVLTDVSFTGNSAASSGGGMLAISMSTSSLTDVEFTGNSAESGGGGLLVATGGSSVLTNVTFTENLAHDGGGMFTLAGSSTLENVVFSGNEVEGRGGGFNRFGGDSTSFSNVSFLQNMAGLDGGAIWSTGSGGAPPLTLTNVSLWGNEAGDAGGGIYNISGSLSATNVTISGNVATGDGGGIFYSGDIAELTNTIFWGNTAEGDGNEIYNFEGSTTQLFYGLYSDEPGDIVENGGFEAENSLTDDPLFVDPENGDLRLTEASPAIDAGDPDTDFALFPVDDDGDPIDLDGNPRVFGEAIDIGAYELQGTIDEEASPEEAYAEVLGAPTPNPTGKVSTLTIAVERGQNVTVEVFDVMGRRVQTLYEGALAAGMSERLTLDASVLPSGVYVIRATGEDFVKTRRVTVLR